MQTNLNTYIDLLGLDKDGNTVVIELKREKTPRETVAQILEYASFVDNLDYSDLNSIYQKYNNIDSITLKDEFKAFFNPESAETISFNKESKLLIIGENISPEIKQTALYLRKKGINIYCIEFKYFVTESGEELLAREIVVGKDDYIKKEIQTASLPKINESIFMEKLDENGKRVFKKIFYFSKKEGFLIKWGTKGFSFNIKYKDMVIALFYGYHKESTYGQSIFTSFEVINRKMNNSQEIIELYSNELSNLKYFIPASSNFKLIINKSYSDDEIERFINVLKKVRDKIENS